MFQAAPSVHESPNFLTAPKEGCKPHPAICKCLPAVPAVSRGPAPHRAPTWPQQDGKPPGRSHRGGGGTHHRDAVAHDVCPRMAPTPLCLGVSNRGRVWQPMLSRACPLQAAVPSGARVLRWVPRTAGHALQEPPCTEVPALLALPQAPLLPLEREAKDCGNEIRAASLIAALLAWQSPLPGPEGNRRATAAGKAGELPAQACNFSSRKQSLLGRTP